MVEFWKKLKRQLGLPTKKTGEKKSVWCVIANVVDERHYGEDKEIKRGTKHFSSGTKVYCFPPLWGDGYKKIKVIGRHRYSKKLVTMVIRSKWLTNWRVKMVYSPQIVSQLKTHWDDSGRSKTLAESLVSGLNQRGG
jgi:hypothetical protein